MSAGQWTSPDSKTELSLAKTLLQVASNLHFHSFTALIWCILGRSIASQLCKLHSGSELAPVSYGKVTREASLLTITTYCIHLLQSKKSKQSLPPDYCKVPSLLGSRYNGHIFIERSSAEKDTTSRLSTVFSAMSYNADSISVINVEGERRSATEV